MNCLDCGAKIDALSAFNGRCARCHSERLRASVESVSVEELRADNKSKEGPQTVSNEIKYPKPQPNLYRDVILTTETSHDLSIETRLEIISAEVVVGMNIFKDLFAGVRNITGGRSGTIQKALKDIRVQALDELKREAFDVKADAVIGVTLNYQEIGATGSTMLILVATGTAVKLS